MARTKTGTATPEADATPSYVHRVFPLPEATLDRMRTARDRAVTTNRVWLLEATAARLPRLVESLRALGFGPEDGPRKPTRMPYDAETLEALKTASQMTGLPQTLLLQLVIDQQAAATPARKTRKRTTKKGAK